jgi:hypothetical protein
MRAGDESFERLRTAIEDLAARDVADLLADARAEARSKVRSMLVEAMAQTMLERAREQLEGDIAHPARGEDSVPARAPGGGEKSLGWYVYCVTRGEDLSIPSDLPGIDPGQEVTALNDGELAAIVSRVPLDDFDEEGLRERLTDMAWLERTARRHEDVLDAIRALRTVIPMRLCSIYREESGVRSMLERESEGLETALERVDAKAEWGVKVFLVSHTMPAATRAAQEPGADDAGVAYMEGRRREHRQREQDRHGVDKACGSIHERLSAVSVEGLVIAPQRPEVTEHSGTMMLNAAYLVDDPCHESFHTEVQALQTEIEPLGLELATTGPWPPYNFIPGTIGAAW